MAGPGVQQGANGTAGPMWNLEHLPLLRLQMSELGLVSPLLWISKTTCEDICQEKLNDLLHFAPSHWDGAVCSLVIVTRGVLMGTADYRRALLALSHCQDFVTGSDDVELECPVLRQYRRAMKHLIDSTATMLACLHRGLGPLSVLPHLGASVPSVRELSAEDRSAILAVQSLALQVCHYALWPSLMDERKPLFRQAVAAAKQALVLNPKEGFWYTLYARTLPASDPEKSILLQQGMRLRLVAFTVVEYAMFLSHSGHQHAVEEAARLCRLAVKMWPGSVYANSTYVTLFLGSNCRSKLNLATAEECLRRARKLAPDSPLLAGHAWSLRDVGRAGGQLSPILEEGDDPRVDLGEWTPLKEERLRSIAARMYPAAARQEGARRGDVGALPDGGESPPLAVQLDGPQDQNQPPRTLQSGRTAPPPTGQLPGLQDWTQAPALNTLQNGRTTPPDVDLVPLTAQAQSVLQAMRARISTPPPTGQLPGLQDWTQAPALNALQNGRTTPLPTVQLGEPQNQLLNSAHDKGLVRNGKFPGAPPVQPSSLPCDSFSRPPSAPRSSGGVAPRPVLGPSVAAAPATIAPVAAAPATTAPATTAPATTAPATTAPATTAPATTAPATTAPVTAAPTPDAVPGDVPRQTSFLWSPPTIQKAARQNQMALDSLRARLSFGSSVVARTTASSAAAPAAAQAAAPSVAKVPRYPVVVLPPRRPRSASVSPARPCPAGADGASASDSADPVCPAAPGAPPHRPEARRAARVLWPASTSAPPTPPVSPPLSSELSSTTQTAPSSSASTGTTTTTTAFRPIDTAATTTVLDHTAHRVSLTTAPMSLPELPSATEPCPPAAVVPATPPPTPSPPRDAQQSPVVAGAGLRSVTPAQDRLKRFSRPLVVPDQDGNRAECEVRPARPLSAAAEPWPPGKPAVPARSLSASAEHLPPLKPGVPSRPLSATAKPWPLGRNAVLADPAALRSLASKNAPARPELRSTQGDTALPAPVAPKYVVPKIIQPGALTLPKVAPLHKRPVMPVAASSDGATPAAAAPEPAHKSRLAAQFSRPALVQPVQAAAVPAEAAEAAVPSSTHSAREPPCNQGEGRTCFGAVRGARGPLSG
ncbi:hypothetical protein ONE63_000833 [Megalurothrips usitatus]|uniref:Uncharacterized protein n=1 Tax=Megalurothrips usitatus TaxID=439358 RepID=A0AAV7Y3F9_9NEOP|nr:hypothetical protein ONE63_000833 [Megalurothrips usitatus]